MFGFRSLAPRRLRLVPENCSGISSAPLAEQETRYFRPQGPHRSRYESTCSASYQDAGYTLALLDPRARLALAATMAGFLLSWEATASVFMFPEIRESLAGGDVVQASWVLTITGVISSALLLLSGRLGERVGYGTLYQVGLLLFCGTSLLSGAAPNLLVLIVFRSLAAASIAVIAPSSIAIIAATAPADAQARAIARYVLWAGIASFTAPITMTLLVSTLSWRYGYFVQAPFVLVVVLMSRTSVEVPGRNRSRQIPIVDAVMSAVAVGFIVLALSNSNEWGWRSASFLGSSGTAVILLIAVLRRSSVQDPFIPLDLFRTRRYRFVTVIALIMSIAFFAQWLVMLLYLTEVWTFSLVEAGLLLSTTAGVMVVVAVPAGRIVDRVGHFPVIVCGMFIYTIGFGQFWLLAGDGRSNVLLFIALVGAGIGTGTVWPTIKSAAVFGVPADRLGSAAAMVNATQRIGGAFGIALPAALVANEVGATTSTQYLRAISIMPIVGLVTFVLSFGLRGTSGPYGKRKMST